MTKQRRLLALLPLGMNILTKKSFTGIIGFTNIVKVVNKVKVINRKALECVEIKFLKLPNIQKYEVILRNEKEFVASVEMDDGFEFQIHACMVEMAYPSTVMQLLERNKDKDISILVAPYISERTAVICEKNGIGYFDYAGNCYFVGHSIYLSEKGNKNPEPEKARAASVFERSSVVSSMILREIFADIIRPWKLKHLAEKVNCSIGQVSKVMDFLLKNAWAEKTKEGYLISEPELLLEEWSNIYGKKEIVQYPCYTLDSLPVLEEKLRLMKRDTGIDYYLSGIAGGVRYAPVVRYNKVHVYIAPEDMKEAIAYLELKEVSSGANVVILTLENDTYIKDSRVAGTDMVVSPLQIYLDCMQLKGRGEEMAEAVLRREILK